LNYIAKALHLSTHILSSQQIFAAASIFDGIWPKLSVAIGLSLDKRGFIPDYIGKGGRNHGIRKHTGNLSRNRLISRGWWENGQCMLKMHCRTGEIAAVMTNRNPGVDQQASGVEWLADRKSCE